MRADIHDGPEQMLQSKAGYIDARPLTASSAKPLATHGRTIHWVISAILTVVRLLPVFPQFQTCRCTALTDAMCQKPNSLQAHCSAGRKVRPANICALGISAQLARFRKCRRRVPPAPRSPAAPAPASVALARMAENPE